MLHDRLLVEPDPEGERRSKSGILIPATVSVSTRLSWANVVAAGSNVRQVRVGDRVLFDPGDRAEVELDAKVYVLLRERGVHAVYEDAHEGDVTGLYL